MVDISVGHGQLGGEWICGDCGKFFTSQGGHECKKLNEIKVYACKCGKYKGTKHGLETHKRMIHKV